MPCQELTRPSFTRKRGVGINQESSWHGRNFASNTVLYSQVFHEARCLVLMVTKQRRLIGRPDFLCPILLMPHSLQTSISSFGYETSLTLLFRLFQSCTKKPHLQGN